MNKPSTKTGMSDLEAEYLRVKVTLYRNLFKYCAILILVLIAKEAVKAISHSNTGSFIMISVLFCFGCVLAVLFANLKNNHELMITVCFTIFYNSALFIQYYTKSGYFDNSIDTFNFAFAYAVFERLVVSRISKYSHRTAFIVITTMFRIFLIRTEDKSLFFAQFLYLSFSVFLDYDKEQYDQNFFLTYFRNKEQLIKFKNLIVQDIPESIIIMTHDLMKPLFVNNSFKELIGGSETFDARSKLQQLIIKDNVESSKESEEGSTTSLTSISTPDTLLKYLESTMHNNTQPCQSQKFSCNISYKKSANSKESQIFEAKVIHLTWDELPAIAVVLHDITEQHTILSLKLANAHKDTVLATVSHELRTPLNGMLGMIQIMLKQVTDNELRHYLDICKNSGNLLLGLVNSILDLNQIRANKLKLNQETISVRDLLSDITSLFKFQCNQKGLKLELQMTSSCPQYITTDKNRLSQIFINLVGNALKFTKLGRITISASESSNTEYIYFSVEDTGTGIKDEDKKKLFQVFGKLEQSDKELNPHGVGLGLTISDKLVRMLGNKTEGIHLRSQYGKGSKFSFTVMKDPRESKEEIETDRYINSFDLSRNFSDERAGAGGLKGKIENYSTRYIKDFQMPTPPHSPVNHNRSSFLLSPSNFSLHPVAHRKCNSVSIPNNISPAAYRDSLLLQSGFHPNGVRNIHYGYVLVVDDNPLNIMIAEKLISSHGYQVKTAMDGQTAIKIVMESNYNTEPIKLILMDCQMPEMDGFMVTKMLKRGMLEKRIPEIPIVALTANDSEADKEASKKSGMCEHLSKPLNESELTRVLRKYMTNGSYALHQ